VPPEWTQCTNNSECMLAPDCCGQNGFQYAINEKYRINFRNYIDCRRTNFICVADLHRTLNPYRETVCYDGKCIKTR
jgi:hypothetical protein